MKTHLRTTLRRVALMSVATVLMIGSGANAADWQQATAGGLPLSFEMPGEIVKQDEDPGESHSVDLDNGNTAYKIYVRPTDNDGLEQNSAAFLDTLRDTLVKELNGKVIDEEDIKLDGHPGRELLLKLPEGMTYRQRCYAVGKHMVQAIVVLAADSNSTPADVNRFFNSLKLGQGGGDVAAGWKRGQVGDIGLSFEMPGEIVSEDENPGVSHSFDSADGETALKVFVRPVNRANLENDAGDLFDSLRDTLMKELKGKVIDEEDIKLDGHPGRELLLKLADGMTYRQRCYVVGNHMLQVIAVIGANSKTTPAEVNHFFSSVSLGKKGVPAPPRAANSTKLFESFVQGVSDQDGEALWETMHPGMQALIDPPIFQLYLSVLGDTLGKVTAATTDDFSAETKQEGDDEIVSMEDTVAFQKGTAKIRLETLNGQLVSFKIDAPQADPLEPKIFAKIGKLTEGLQPGKLPQFFRYYEDVCGEFLETLFRGGARQAYDSLHPEVQKALPWEKVGADLGKIIKLYAPIEDADLVTAGIDLGGNNGANEMKIGLELTREGKPPVTADFSFQLIGFKAVITGYLFSDSKTPPPTEPAEMPAAAASLIEEGQKELENRDYEAAEKSFSTAVRAAPKFAEPYFYRALSYEKLGKYDEAIADLDQADALSPGNDSILNNRAWMRVLKGDYAEAQAEFDHVLKIDPQKAIAWKNRGWTRFAQEDFAGALSDLNKAIELDPEMGWAYYNRGMVHHAQNNFAAALADYKVMLRMEPDFPFIVNSVAWLLATCPDASVRDGQEAIRVAQHNIDLPVITEPERGNQYDTLAAGYAEIGDFDAAVKYQAEALKRVEDEELKTEMEEHMALYRAGRPARERRRFFGPGVIGTGTADPRDWRGWADPAPSDTPPPPTTEPPAPPASGATATFTNNRDVLNEDLKAKFCPFTFDYPTTGGWKLLKTGEEEDEKNFVEVVRSKKIGDANFTYESFNVGSFTLEGPPQFAMLFVPQLVTQLSDKLGAQLLDYKKESEGEVTINGAKGYQSFFSGALDATGHGKVKIYGRLLLLSGADHGVSGGVGIVIFTSDIAGVKNVKEAGEMGDPGAMLRSFKIGETSAVPPPPKVD